MCGDNISGGWADENMISERKLPSTQQNINFKGSKDDHENRSIWDLSLQLSGNIEHESSSKHRLQVFGVAWHQWRSCQKRQTTKYRNPGKIELWSTNKKSYRHSCWPTQVDICLETTFRPLGVLPLKILHALLFPKLYFQSDLRRREASCWALLHISSLYLYYATSLGGRIKRCTPPVCLSVSTSHGSDLESHRNF